MSERKDIQERIESRKEMINALDDLKVFLSEEQQITAEKKLRNNIEVLELGDKIKYQKLVLQDWATRMINWEKKFERDCAEVNAKWNELIEIGRQMEAKHDRIASLLRGLAVLKIADQEEKNKFYYSLEMEIKDAAKTKR